MSGIKPQIDKLTDGCYYDVFSYKNRPLTVVVDNDEVVHVGYTIFSPMQREFVGRDIADFIERYWLSTDLPLKRLKTVEQQMREDRVVFFQRLYVCNCQVARRFNFVCADINGF